MTLQPPPESAEPAPELLCALWDKCARPGGHEGQCVDQWAGKCRADLDWPRRPHTHEPAPVATDTQARDASQLTCSTCGKGRGGNEYCSNAFHLPATPAPAGDAEVSHERNRERCRATRKNPAGSVVQCVHPRNHLGVHAGLGGEWPNQAEDFDDSVPLPPLEPPAEVSHEQARGCVQLLSGGTWSLSAARKLGAYVDQCEARQQQAEREVAELRVDLDNHLNAFADEMRQATGHEDSNPECPCWRCMYESRGYTIASVNKTVADLRATLQGKDETIAELREDLDQLANHLYSDWTNRTDVGGKAMARLKAAINEMNAAHEEIEGYREQRDELSRKLEAAERRVVELEAELGYEPRSCVDPKCPVGGEHHHLRTPPDQAPPAKPLTEADVKTIARAVVAEVAERAERDAVAGSYDNARLCLSLLAEAAREESGE